MKGKSLDIDICKNAKHLITEVLISMHCFITCNENEVETFMYMSYNCYVFPAQM